MPIESPTRIIGTRPLGETCKTSIISRAAAEFLDALSGPNRSYIPLFHKHFVYGGVIIPKITPEV